MTSPIATRGAVPGPASPLGLGAAPGGPRFPTVRGPRPDARRDALADARRGRRFGSARTTFALILREMGTTYGRSPGGYLWAVLEPVAGIAILSAFFSLAFSRPALGDNFALFYATGVMPFMIFTDLQVKVAQALNFSRPLMAYPSVTFVDAIVARFVLNTLTEIMVCYLIFTGIIVFMDPNVILDLPTVAEGLALSCGLALGVGTLNCYLFSRFQLYQRVWSILMRPMMIISGVMFVYDSIPQPYDAWLWWNPLIHVVGLVRRGFYVTYDATYVSVPYVLAVTGVSLAGGLLLLGRYHRMILKEF